MDDVRVNGASDLEATYRETGERLWWSLLAYTGDPDLASDAMAESFARALGTRTTIVDPQAWVWRVAFRVATTELKHARRQTAQTETSYELDHRTVEVLDALRRLSRNQRAVTVLFYLDDRPAREIAALLGMAPATVSVHLHRARMKLRTILGEDHA